MPSRALRFRGFLACVALLSPASLAATGCGDPPRPDEPPSRGERSAEPATDRTRAPDAADPLDAEAAADGRDVPSDVPPTGDRPVVAFLGTSLTAGYGLADAALAYPTRLAATADSAGTPIAVVNAGVSGDTSAGGLRRLDWVLDRSLDVLVIELGANDGLRGQDPASLEANLRAIVRRAREHDPDLPVILLGMEAPPNLGPEYTRRFRAVFPRVARDEGATLVPFLLEGVAGEPDLNQADGVHPTAAGHARMARNLWPTLHEVLVAMSRSDA
jgi:acyl-CoA thioesterase-1